MAKTRRRSRRKGRDGVGEQMVYLSTIPTEKKKAKSRILSPRQVRNLSRTDAITGSILMARRHQISQCEWDIIPDTERYESDLNRWLKVLEAELDGFGGIIDFQPQWISTQWFQRLAPEVKRIMNGRKNERAKRVDIKKLFEIAKSGLRMEAEEHCETVKEKIERPNDKETSWNALMNLVVENILLFDAGIIVKNRYEDSNEIAELYSIPGEEIFIYLNEDDTVPLPPDPAYVREKNGQLMAEFTNDELVYIMANPSSDGYGFSPLELAAYVISVGLKIDIFNSDFFEESNIPTSLMNLGGVSRAQLGFFRQLWAQELSGIGKTHKMLMANLPKDSVNYIPLRQYTAKDMEMINYLKWTLSVKCACFQISPQDLGFTMDLHRTTAEVQYRISKDRGLKSLLSTVSAYVNNEIVKKEWPRIKDVKFTYIGLDKLDEAEQSQIDGQDIQMGVISVNTRRQHLGEAPVPGGDVIVAEGLDGRRVPIEMLEEQAKEMRSNGDIIQEEQIVQPGQAKPQGAGAKTVPAGKPKPAKAAAKKAPAKKTTKKAPAKGKAKGVKKGLDSDDLEKQHLFAGEDVLIDDVLEIDDMSSHIQDFDEAFAGGLMVGSPVDEIGMVYGAIKSGRPKDLVAGAGVLIGAQVAASALKTLRRSGDVFAEVASKPLGIEAVGAANVARVALKRAMRASWKGVRAGVKRVFRLFRMSGPAGKQLEAHAMRRAKRAMVRRSVSLLRQDPRMKLLARRGLKVVGRKRALKTAFRIGRRFAR